ncbi:hypothetical protein BsWGS_11552 [Bradybaena similaris]
MNPARSLEDFLTPFTSKHFKSKTKHSSAKHSASEAKPLIPTEECEHDSEHKHVALVLSNPQCDELCRKEEISASSSSDIPLTVLPTYTNLPSYNSNQPASPLQKSVNNDDIKAALSNQDTGFTTVGDSKSLSYVHDHALPILRRQVSTGADHEHLRTSPAEYLAEVPVIPTSHRQYCQNDARLALTQAHDQSQQCSCLTDPCLPSLTQSLQVETSDDQNTIALSNLSGTITSNSPRLSENALTPLRNGSCSSDGNENTIPALQSPSKNTCDDAKTSLGSGIAETSCVRDQCTMTLMSEGKEQVGAFVSSTNVTPEESKHNETTKCLPGHQKARLDNPRSLLVQYPQFGSLYVGNASSTHQVDRPRESTSIEEPTFHLKNKVSDGSYACHVKSDTDVYHSSSYGEISNSIAQSSRPGCLYPSTSDKLDVCVCGKGFRIHYPQLMNDHGSHSEPTRESDYRILVADKSLPTRHAHFCNSDFISSSPHSKRFIHSPACGLRETVTPHTQHSGVEVYRNPSESNPMHTHESRIYCITNSSTQVPYDPHPRSVDTISSQLISSAGDLNPGDTRCCVCISQKTTTAQSGQRCHCDQHLHGRTLPCNENSINNIQMAGGGYNPEIQLRSNRSCFDANALESRENRVGCKRDHERTSVLSSIDSGHPENREGSLQRSNTSELGLLKVSSSASSDRDVPNYAILCIVATVLNPVFGLAAFLCNHYAQINFRLHKRARANNLYFATITISTAAIFLTLVAAVLAVTHLAVVRSEDKWTPTTPPSLDNCESRLFGYDESLKTFFNIDFRLYCEITKNEKIMEALKRFWLEDNHNKKKNVNIQANDMDCNDTQKTKSNDIGLANNTLMEGSSVRAKDPFVNVLPEEEHRDSEKSAPTAYTPQLPKPFEDKGSSHNTILSSSDGPVVPPELEEEYRQFLEGHTRTKVGSLHPALHRPTADNNLPAQTPAPMGDTPTTDIASGSNTTAT